MEFVGAALLLVPSIAILGSMVSGTIMFGVFSAILTILCGGLYCLVRLELPEWCAIPALLAIWLLWAAVLARLSIAWLLL